MQHDFIKASQLKNLYKFHCYFHFLNLINFIKSKKKKYFKMSNITDYLNYVNYLNSVRDSVTYYPTLITLPVGLIGNIISIFTFSRPNLNKKTNSGFLYIWLCAFNLCLILYFTFVFESTILFDYSVSFPCGVSNYLFRSIWCFVPWMQVIICVDRFIVVFFPIKKALMSKKVRKNIK